MEKYLAKKMMFSFQFEGEGEQAVREVLSRFDDVMVSPFLGQREEIIFKPDEDRFEKHVFPEIRGVASMDRIMQIERIFHEENIPVPRSRTFDPKEFDFEEIKSRFLNVHRNENNYQPEKRIKNVRQQKILRRSQTVWKKRK